jgi:hypothetical protein
VVDDAGAGGTGGAGHADELTRPGGALNINQ